MNISKTIYKISVIAIVALIAGSCAVGPKFQKVKFDNPDKFRFQAGVADTSSLLVWEDLFKDPVLSGLIDSALKYNLNVQIAAARIAEAKASLGMAKADMLPSFSYNGKGAVGNTLGTYPTGSGAAASFYALGNVNWELDFWGKYRKSTEAARANLLASEYGLKSLQLSLISEVANGYYLLLDLRNRLAIAENTLKTRKESSRIIAERFDKGIVPEIDLNQAEIQEAYAAASIPTIQRSIALTENAMSVMLGQNPKSIMTGTSIENIAIPDSIQVGLPSQLLERRPDILKAEQLLKAQNAQIGVAQAMRFPSISLTGLLGLASPDLESFNAGDDNVGSVGASMLGPIFNFGKNKRRVEAAKEKTEQLRLSYKNTVLTAFRETEDALVTIETLNRELVFVKKQVSSAKNAARLSKKRYDGGVTSYLEVLEAERTLFDIELYNSELRQKRLAAYIDLYKVLGGGWQ